MLAPEFGTVKLTIPQPLPQSAFHLGPVLHEGHVLDHDSVWVVAHQNQYLS
jgi:hypothetical protein